MLNANLRGVTHPGVALCEIRSAFRLSFALMEAFDCEGRL